VDGVFGLRVSDVYGGSDFHEAVELGCKVFVHADAAVSAGVVFDPAGVESVVGFEFAPVGHWCALKQPAGRLFT